MAKIEVSVHNRLLNIYSTAIMGGMNPKHWEFNRDKWAALMLELGRHETFQTGCDGYIGVFFSLPVFIVDEPDCCRLIMSQEGLMKR